MYRRRKPEDPSESEPGSSLRSRSSGSLRLSGADIDRLLESLHQPAALCTLDTHVLLVNPAFEKAHSSQLDPERPLASDAAARDTLSAGNIWQGPTRLADAATLVPLRSADGRVGACLALLPGEAPSAEAPSASDAAEVDRLRAQLERLERTESLGQLASGVAHDFNNVLAVILNYVTLAERRLEPGAPAADALEHIRDAAERSADMTQQLLALGRGPLNAPSPIDANATLANLSPVLVGTLGDRIEYSEELDERLWRVRLAAGQLQRILLNFAVNSRDAMPGGGTFRVRTANVQVDAVVAARYKDLAPGRYVQLEIRDTGPGMSQEVADHIFEPFFTTKEAGAGTGLGLSIIHGIVKQAGGHITVWSRVGAGTTFTLYLPVDEASATSPSPRPTDPARTILVVDDERPLRRAVARMLADGGYVVLQAADGVEALELLEAESAPVDLVLTDVLMPRMSGVELVKRLADLHPAVETVLMSGYTHGLISQGGLETGRLLYLQKPFTKEDLLEKLELAWQRAAASARRLQPVK